MLFPLPLLVELLLQLNDLVGQCLEFFLIQVGRVLCSLLVLAAQLFNNLGQLGVLLDQFLDALLQLLILSDEVLGVQRLVKGLVREPAVVIIGRYF